MNFVCDAVVVMDTDDAVGIRPVRARGMCSHVFDVYLFDEQLVGYKIPKVSSRKPALGYATNGINHPAMSNVACWSRLDLKPKWRR